MSKRPFVDKVVLKALNDTGLPWTITNGKRHKHIRLNGALVGILPLGNYPERSPNSTKNVVAHIRRAAKEAKEAQDDGGNFPR